MKKFLIPIAVLGLISFVVASQPSFNRHSTAAKNEDRGGKKGLKARAELTGDQENPPNDSDAEGRFEIQFDCDFTEARFELKVEAEDVLQAHLHCGDPEDNGSVVVFLFGLFPGGVDVDGTLSEFTITQANLDAVNADCMEEIGYQIETMEDLANAIAVGDVYANVHTVAFPAGEIRGQLELTRRQSRCVDIDNGNDNDNDNDNGNENENENDNNNENDNGHNHGP